MVQASKKLLFQLRASGVNGGIEFGLSFFCCSINTVTLYLRKRMKYGFLNKT
jgi:hypothetical protein